MNWPTRRRWVTLRGLRGRTGALGIALVLCALLALSGCDLPTLGSGSFGQTTTSGKATTVHVHVLHGGSGSVLVIVPITINGHGPYNFALDTGASITILSDQIAQSIGLPTAGPGQPVAGVGGNEVAVPVRVDKWSLGGLELPASIITRGKLPDSSKSNGLEGLLGSDVLSKFGQLTIDYSAGTVTFYNTSAISTSTGYAPVALDAA